MLLISANEFVNFDFSAYDRLFVVAFRPNFSSFHNFNIKFLINF